MSVNTFVRFLIYVAAFVVIWNIFDFAFSTYVTRSGYEFAVMRGLIEPLGPAVLCGAIFYLFPEMKNRRKFK